MDDEATANFGTNCLLAGGWSSAASASSSSTAGSGSGWDAHAISKTTTPSGAESSDKPIAGLLADLKARGMLDDTLVVWGGEFGRTPFNEKGDGRDHNPWGFTMWMAGGGVKGGQTIGTTDEIGLARGGAARATSTTSTPHAVTCWAWITCS